MGAIEEIRAALPPLENRVSLLEASDAARKNGNGLLVGSAATGGGVLGAAVTAFWKPIAIRLGLE